jgi:hypothetical protein
MGSERWALENSGLIHPLQKKAGRDHRNGVDYVF